MALCIGMRRRGRPFEGRKRGRSVLVRPGGAHCFLPRDCRRRFYWCGGVGCPPSSLPPEFAMYRREEILFSHRSSSGGGLGEGNASQKSLLGPVSLLLHLRCCFRDGKRERKRERKAEDGERPFSLSGLHALALLTSAQGWRRLQRRGKRLSLSLLRKERSIMPLLGTSTRSQQRCRLRWRWRTRRRRRRAGLSPPPPPKRLSRRIQPFGRGRRTRRRPRKPPRLATTT